MNNKSSNAHSKISVFYAGLGAFKEEKYTAIVKQFGQIKKQPAFAKRQELSCKEKRLSLIKKAQYIGY